MATEHRRVGAMCPIIAQQRGTDQTEHAGALLAGAAAAQEAHREHEGAHGDEHDGGRLPHGVAVVHADHLQVLVDVGIHPEPDANTQHGGATQLGAARKRWSVEGLLTTNYNVSPRRVP